MRNGGRSGAGKRTKSDKSVYQRVREADCQIDSHESDLYVRVTDVSRRIMMHCVSDGVLKRIPSIFVDNIDKQEWYDCAFQYEPFSHAPGRDRAVFKAVDKS